MNPRALLCKLPKWLGGDHRWRRLRKAEDMPMWAILASTEFDLDHKAQIRICSRCDRTRLAKARKGRA